MNEIQGSVGDICYAMYDRLGRARCMMRGPGARRKAERYALLAGLTVKPTTYSAWAAAWDARIRYRLEDK